MTGKLFAKDSYAVQHSTRRSNRGQLCEILKSTSVFSLPLGVWNETALRNSYYILRRAVNRSRKFFLKFFLHFPVHFAAPTAVCFKLASTMAGVRKGLRPSCLGFTCTPTPRRAKTAKERMSAWRARQRLKRLPGLRSGMRCRRAQSTPSFVPSTTDSAVS